MRKSAMDIVKHGHSAKYAHEACGQGDSRHTKVLGKKQIRARVQEHIDQRDLRDRKSLFHAVKALKADLSRQIKWNLQQTTDIDPRDQI
jgi:hypothetical protein